MYAITKNNAEIVKLVLETKDIDANQKNNFGLSPLQLASIVRNYEIAALLIEKGADVNKKNKNNVEALLYSISEGVNNKLSILLIEKGATVDTENQSGALVLKKAADYGNVEIAKLLLEKGAKVGVATWAGMTPLTGAASNGHVEMVKLLLQHGSGESLDGKNLEYALKEARKQKHSEIIALLENPPIKEEKTTEVSQENALEKEETVVEKEDTKEEVVTKKSLPEPNQAFTKGLVAPEAKKPGVALISLYDKDSMTVNSFEPDKKKDSLIKVLVKGTSPLIAVRIETVGGKAGSWKTSGSKASAMGVIKVENSEKILNPNNSSFDLDVVNPIELNLIFQDNGAIADSKNRIRITLFHKDGTRSYALVKQ